MEDRVLISRRKGELVRQIESLREDIVQSEEHIQKNELELVELENLEVQVNQVEKALEQLRGARPKGKKPRIPNASKNPRKPKKRSPEKQTVAGLIIEVLQQEGRPMRPVEIDRHVRELVQYEMHEKHVGKECCRLFNDGRLLKDEFTREYSVPPDWDDNRTPTSKLSSQTLKPAKGRKAVPGGAQ